MRPTGLGRHAAAIALPDGFDRLPGERHVCLGQCLGDDLAGRAASLRAAGGAQSVTVDDASDDQGNADVAKDEALASGAGHCGKSRPWRATTSML